MSEQVPLQRQGGQRAWGRGLAVAAAALVLLWLACGRPTYEVWRQATPHRLSLEQVSQITLVQVPAGTRLVGSSSTDWLGFVVEARLELGRAQLEEFLGQPRLQGEWSTTERGYFPGYYVPYRGCEWWEVNRVVKLRSFHYTGKRPSRRSNWLPQEDLDLLVGLDDPARVTVYLRWVFDD